MKRLSTLFTGAVLVVATTACAQQTARNPGGVTPKPPDETAHLGHTHAPTYGEGTGNSWFERTQIDLGTFFDEETAVGRFEFHNPSDVEQKMSRLTPSCQCSKAITRIGGRTYEVGADKTLRRVTTNEDGTEIKEQVSHIQVAPGEKGEVEVHMTMHDIRGQKEADLAIQTSDEELPVINLKWRATGAVYFQVDPPEVNLNEMTWTDEREFEFRIRSPLKKDFNLVSHEPLSTGMKVSYEKEMQGDQAVWLVKGTYGPGASERDQGGAITFKTDVDDKTVTARVIAFLKGPLTMAPGGFVSLGHVKRNEGKEVEITLTPAGTFDLQVEKLEVDRLRITEEQRKFVTFDHHKNGKDVVVTIKVEKGMPPAYVNGVLKIYLNHPAAQTKEVMFNGFVR